MELQELIKIFVYIHAGFGGLALVAGLVALSAKKGQKIHRNAGKVFFFAMLLSALMALVIAVMPKHESPFLFAIGIFSSYFVLTGIRALRFRGKELNFTVDKVISGTMIATGLAMVLYSPIFQQKINIVLTVFGGFGFVFAMRDLMLFRQPEKLRKDWLKLHLGKMTGGYIAATTAFVVVNNFFPGIYGWFIPGVLGGIYIAYWLRQVDGKKAA